MIRTKRAAYVLAALFLSAIGCATVRELRPAAPGEGTARTFPVPYDEAFKAAENVLQEMGLSIERADKDRGLILGKGTPRRLAKNFEGVAKAASKLAGGVIIFRVDFSRTEHGETKVQIVAKKENLLLSGDPDLVERDFIDGLREPLANYAERKTQAARPAERPSATVPVEPSESRPPRPSLSVQIPEEPGSKWAVIVGIGEYYHPQIPKLKYARKDAQAVYDYLVDSRGGGFSREKVRLLLDEKASKVNILSSLGTFLARSPLKNDTVFIFYAGHGAPETDYTRREADGFSKYLVPYDANPDDLYATAIPMSEIQTIFERIESDRLIFVADACYSGASGGRTFSSLKRARDIRITDTFMSALAQGRGRVIITAADANEVSLELDELGHGIFTYYLLEGLHGKADANRDGAVSIREAYDYLFDKVVRHSKQVGGNQHPVWKGDTVGQILFGLPAR